MVKNNPSDTAHQSSFRDPSGYIFQEKGEIYRRINTVYLPIYRQLKKSGLYEALVKTELMVSHEEIKEEKDSLVIKPEQLPFISYPYEWTFHQLQDAALLTLKIQRLALECGMSLKDASAYNIQFYQGKPIFIDTLSFEAYEEGRPWVAYRQFCQHFLGPLALMAKADIRANQLLRSYIDGLPLDLVKNLLPFSSRFNLGLLTHLIWHAGVQSRYADTEKSITKVQQAQQFSRAALLGLLDNLESTTRGLSPARQQTEWGEYYTFTNYSDKAFLDKKAAVLAAVEACHPKAVCDMGANSGEFSQVLAEKDIFVISSDSDPIAVDLHYQKVHREGQKNILPLLIDVTNPSPGIGWMNTERESFAHRLKADMVLVLALIHHLAISNNLPFGRIAEMLAELAPNLLIEFVPKEDSQVQKLLAHRVDVFDQYNQKEFEAAFDEYFTVEEKRPVAESKRTLYLMKRK